MSEDNPTLAQEAVEGGARVDDVIDAIAAARGKPSPIQVQQPHPHIRVNTATGEVSYATPQDEALAAELAGQPQEDDILDNVSLAASQRQLLARLGDAQARLDEHTFNAETGEKIYRVQGRDRENLERQVNDLGRAAVEQHERYSRALDARQRKAEQAQRDIEGDAMATEWIAGNPQRRATLAKAIEEYEARQLAEVIVRKRLGQL